MNSTAFKKGRIRIVRIFRPLVAKLEQIYTRCHYHTVTVISSYKTEAFRLLTLSSIEIKFIRSNKFQVCKTSLQWRIQDFPQGGAPTPKIAIIFQIFAENCMKMKEFGPPGARVPGAPLRPGNALGG